MFWKLFVVPLRLLSPPQKLVMTQVDFVESIVRHRVTLLDCFLRLAYAQRDYSVIYPAAYSGGRAVVIRG
jgi:hypothetical protein